MRRASLAGVSDLALADHESVGAFHLDGGRLAAQADEMGVRLIPAIEIDAEVRGHEVHVLGHGIDPQSPELLTHCQQIQLARRRRTAEELVQVNERLGGVLREDEVFIAQRETFMRPNLILPLLDKRLFPSYGAAARWFSDHIRPITQLGRPSVTEAIALIHHAGGRAAIAHPGYGIVEGWLDLEADLRSFAQAGLDAVEWDYPYAVCSPQLFDQGKEAAVMRSVREVAATLGLELTAGSDSHRPEEFEARWVILR
ncbi:MAG: hypothetical protein U0556_03915 [Dehalococcoidia bacterium]